MSGPIPAELGDLTYLHALGLFGNQLSGCIPGELGEIFRNDVDALGLPFCEPPAPVATTPAPIASAPVAGSATQDRAALVALYNATDGAHWQTSTHWLTDRPIGEWHGVTVDGEGRVTQLWLFGNQLSGPIPAELGDLTYLYALGLSGNQLSGLIPVELGRLPYLWWLRLDSNQLSGPIPAELASLSNLRGLELYGNQLSGPIPAELASLSNLQELRLDSNQLSGPIPAELGGLTDLRERSRRQPVERADPG